MPPYAKLRSALFRLAPAILAAALGPLAGCTLTLDLHGSTLLNMRARPGTSGPGQEVSELEEVAILQLKTVPEEKQRELLNKLAAEWSVHRGQMATYRAKGNFPEVLAPFLSYPATLLEVKRPDEIFVVNPRDRITREVPIRSQTSHILVMTLGSKQDLRSVQLFDVGLTTGTISLCFHQYDVYRYERGKPWFCPQAPLAQ
ncbi:MAG: hypothetical protein U1A78_23065 [Polyangia bacterium]